MNYIININYNEKGQKLTNRKGISVNVALDYFPNDEQVKTIAYSEVPKEMIDNYSLEDTDFAQLKVGDLVKLTTTETRTYSRMTNVDYVKIVAVNEIGIKVENYKNYFDFHGVEKSRKKKDIAKISIPTEEEIRNHKTQIEHTKLVEEIEDLIEAGYLVPLDNYDLKSILHILHNDGLDDMID